ncbi:MAG TPA: HEAT repeat domain-containing protein [Phycisphaerae bacterium]|nr:HEAT repeat domain-containing protein [Phycisphaerae bacterium]HON65009.1 HEAT repeat domain-containing protein [Phycisphaerae bacterium]HOQ86383.1 HEAT repeat domain-containing protein [Phycisphaerae bacterium]HPP26821.1 HEAT repeat domain-containing protein [Phycisphaerae bacterium]
MRQMAWTVLSMMVAAEALFAGPLPAGAWLVDLGRDYPRTPQAGVSDADAEITLRLMEAAARVQPDLAEAYLWQYDMLVALDRMNAARQALGRYVRLQPDDIAAHLDWVSLEIERLQTAEERAEFCTNHLKSPGLPPSVASDLHRRLAEFHLNRGERDAAAAELEASINAYELNFTARNLRKTLRKENDSMAGAPSLDDLLLALSACPNDPALARSVADRLMELGLPEAAERLYAHVVALLRQFDPEGELAIALTDYAMALQVTEKSSQAREQIEEAAKVWKQLLAEQKGDLAPELTGYMAWFYAFHQSQPREAEKLARLALAELPDLIVARRALGSALRQLGRLDEAQAELAPIADLDTAAAAEYALTLAAARETDAAKEALGKATTRPADPLSRIIVRDAVPKVGIEYPATRSAPPEAARTVKAFPWEVLDYPLNPRRYLSLSFHMPRAEMPPGEPWLLTVRLTNIGPFPITLGAGMMVSPDLLLTVETQGDRPRTSGPTLRFSLNRTPRLNPGESVEIAHTVDLGVIRSGMIGTPQIVHDVTVRGVLSPISFLDAQGQEVVVPAPGGFAADPLKFKRTAFVPTDDNMGKLMSRLRSADALDRIAALELLTPLLAEHQHVAAGRLKYSARPIDAAALQAAILGMASDSDWHVRARLAECLRWFGLNKAAVDTVNALLNDSHWLVRGLAMRTLADHYGPKAQPVLSQAAQADPDEWVRHLAAALNARIAAAAAPPAPQPALPAPQQ